MKHVISKLLLALLLGVVIAASAHADDWDGCTILSFDPLGLNLPACNRLIDAADLPSLQLAEIHAARAQAQLWATTYHFGHEVDIDDLLLAALADLDRAAALDPRFLADRDELRQQLEIAQ